MCVSLGAHNEKSVQPSFHDKDIDSIENSYVESMSIEHARTVTEQYIISFWLSAIALAFFVLYAFSFSTFREYQILN